MMRGLASYWNSSGLKLIHNFIDSAFRRIQHGIEIEGGLRVAFFETESDKLQNEWYSVNGGSIISMRSRCYEIAPSDRSWTNRGLATDQFQLLIELVGD